MRQKNNFEIITTTDKSLRDDAYADLRQSGNDLERQVVRFSDVEKTGEKALGSDGELHDVYRSTWSLAYPRS